MTAVLMPILIEHIVTSLLALLRVLQMAKALYYGLGMCWPFPLSHLAASCHTCCLCLRASSEGSATQTYIVWHVF